MSAPILETRSLTRRFGGLTAVDNLSLSLEGGKLHAIIGPNGAGKTTFFNLISGLLRPDSGEVFFRGRDITGLPAHEISRLGIKRTFQVKSVFASLSVARISGLHTRARNVFCIRFAMPRATAPHASGSHRRSNRSASPPWHTARPASCHMEMWHFSRSEWRLSPSRSCCCSMNRPAA